jgi:hypothetical protein
MPAKLLPPLFAICCGVCWLGAQAQPPAPTPPVRRQITFSEVAEIFPPSCEFCHGWDQKAKQRGYFMGTYQGLLDGVYRNGVPRREILPGDAENSPLVQYIEGRKTPRMPFRRTPLTTDQVRAIRDWIDAGARPDINTTQEHKVALQNVPVTASRSALWLSCRAPRNLQNIGLRAKLIDEATGKIVAYDWPTEERDLGGRWSQWRLEIPQGSMELPGSVSVVLYVSSGSLLTSAAPSDNDSLDGVIFLLDTDQTTDAELLKQKDLKALAEPQPPPHRRVRINYLLRAASDVTLTISPETSSEAVFRTTDKDLPASTLNTVVWKLDDGPKVAKTGWYVARLSCVSRMPGVFQPELVVMFQIRTD